MELSLGTLRLRSLWTSAPFTRTWSISETPITWERSPGQQNSSRTSARTLQILPTLAPLTWFAANGDEISGTFEGHLTDPDMDGVYDNYETAEVTGGTGRFADATGSFTLGGQIDFTTTPPSFVLPWQGVINFHRHGR
jgi:hypothetical protein